MLRWHLLMTKPRDDVRAEEHLLNQDYEIFRPLLKKHSIVKGRQKATMESLFPRYIFIRLDEEFSNWAAIRSTRGVAKLVRFSEMPVIVPDELICAIKQRVDSSNILDLTMDNPFVYQGGEKVEITSGSFKGLHAVVKAQSSEERVVILLEMLGKQQPLEMPIESLKALS